MSTRAFQLVGALPALAFWSWNYFRFEVEPVHLLSKTVAAAVLLTVPAGIRARMRKDPADLRLAAGLGALVVLLGQFALYARLPELGTGEGIGPVAGIQEVLWDLSFRGAPLTMYGAMALLAGLGTLLMWVMNPAASEDSAS